MSDGFHVVATTPLLSSYVFSVERRTVQGAHERFDRDVVVHGGAVAIVAINENDEVAVLRQYRAAFDRAAYEIPAGTIDGRDDPLLTAQRELLEEVGAKADSWRALGRYTVSPGWTNQIMHIYEARDLTLVASQPLGPEEVAMEVHWWTRDRVQRYVQGDELRDATLSLALHLYLVDRE